MPVDGPPTLSVVVPLYDTRGCARAAVTSWLRQDFPAASYELLVAGGPGRRSLGASLRPLLRPHDRLIACRTDDEASLYAAGADAAGGRILVFTESHVIARKTALARTAEFLESTGAGAACLGSWGIIRGPVGRMEQTQYERDLPAFDALGEWRQAGFRGFAVRADAYRRCGALPVEHHRFAETVLALRLHLAGERIGHLREPVVGHVHGEDLVAIGDAMRLGAWGQCVFREREPALADATGMTPVGWAEAAATAPGIARSLVRTALSGFGRAGRSPMRSALIGELFGGLRGALLRTLTGPAGARLWSSAVTALAERRLRRAASTMTGPRTAPAPADAVAAFDAAKVAWVCAVVAEFRATRPPAPPPATPVDRDVDVAGLGADAFVGFHEAEHDGTRPFRWSRPVALIRIRPPAGEYRLHLDAGSPQTPAHADTQIFVDGRPAGAVPDGRGMTIRLRQPSDCERHISFCCAPFRPGDQGSADPRTLGLQVFGLRLSRLPK